MPADIDAPTAPNRFFAGHEDLRLVVPADPFAVRHALEEALDTLHHHGLSSEDLSLCEIVLAEVLNNIVEHAYRHSPGKIEVSAHVALPRVAFTVVDDGTPMPGGQLPAGNAPHAGPVIKDLPEGGFGWNMIRALSTDVEYLRDGSKNRLSFALVAKRKYSRG